MMIPHGLYWILWMSACFGSPDLPSISSTYKDGVRFDKNTLTLELQNLRLDDSGRHRMTVSSSGDQHIGETSQQLFETIMYVNLTGPEEPLIEGESSANITSEGSGTVSSVLWMKDNNPLSSSNSITFSSDNRSVSISPVHRSDSGEYQCTYSNPVSSVTAKLTLTVNYGPDDVSIEGPDVVDLGNQVVLSCFANSEPSASFSWMFNGSDTGVTTDKYTINKAEFTDSGDYICTAFNRVTNKSESQTHALLVQEGGGGLSAGAIAGIVIGVLVAVGGISGLIVYLTKTNKIPKLNPKQKAQASGAAAKIPQETEPHYEEINDLQKIKGDKAALGKSSESDIYVNVSYEEDAYANVKRGDPNRPKSPQAKVKK